jgi:hypothetical protein
MLKRLGIALLALPLFVVPGWANGPYGFTVGGGLSGSMSAYCAPYQPGSGPGGPGPAQLGPWYLYWPLEAHFTAPAPTGYPYWPSPLGLPNGEYTVPPGDKHSFVNPAAYTPQAPSYWYGR